MISPFLERTPTAIRSTCFSITKKMYCFINLTVTAQTTNYIAKLDMACYTDQLKYGSRKTRFLWQFIYDFWVLLSGL
ncbi:hypothetical protein PITCH_A190053 [uncultured Desulfobacterium sp.]|uniref:Uncharacterized protein n=1 Tax=uncultured Desulfobacterium sp. TaxID=201089 RepID=A0A445MVE0_9BACT|nr:hypothetical protein PITCH_A190053 [uncultured Desulfobacterium sp.]